MSITKDKFSTIGYELCRITGVFRGSDLIGATPTTVIDLFGTMDEPVTSISFFLSFGVMTVKLLGKPNV